MIRPSPWGDNRPVQGQAFNLTPYGRRCALAASARQAPGATLSDEDLALVGLLEGQLPVAGC